MRVKQRALRRVTIPEELDRSHVKCYGELMLQPINGLKAPCCSAAFSLIHCEEKPTAKLLTAQGDVFGMCKKHYDLVTAAVVKAGYSPTMYTLPELDLSWAIATGPPGDNKDELAVEKQKNVQLHALLEWQLAQSAQISGALTALMRAVHHLGSELGLCTKDAPLNSPIDLIGVLNTAIGLWNELVQDRGGERGELVDALAKVEFLEGMVEQLRAVNSEGPVPAVEPPSDSDSESAPTVPAAD